MNLSQVIVSGCVAVVLGIIVDFLRKKGWISKTQAWVIFLITISLWNIGVHYLNKELIANKSIVSIESAIKKISYFKVIEEYDLQTYTRLKNKMIAVAKEHLPEQEMIDAIQPDISNIQRERMRFSTNPWVIEVIRLNIEQIEIIQKVDPDKCFKLLFPEVKGGINPLHYLSEEFLKRRIATDTEMMRSSYSQNRHIITDKEKDKAKENIQSVAKSLHIEYGDDLNILDQPIKGLGKEKIACELVKTMWEKVISLPEEEAAGLTRFILSTE
ncbi:hypothetical protein [Rosenbergiella nectarea]|uniref:hypothetical protein n=1 Tax=Rosenbergiella nectarea TaxID=988801 RepID=UPI001F4DF64B|nr:hypothetical protein [Rosenbergiella nectarea]